MYRVLDLFNVDNHCIGHAIKKLLCSGQRGAKDKTQDVQEAISSLLRYLEMQTEDENENSFYMHPKYQEFLCAIKNLESDARVNPNSLNLAFDVWLLGGNMSESKEAWLIAENERLTKENEQLVRDMHRIDSARQSAISQCAALAERIDEFESVVCGGAIGERGDACMSVDVGNL